MPAFWYQQFILEISWSIMLACTNSSNENVEANSKPTVRCSFSCSLLGTYGHLKMPPNSNSRSLFFFMFGNSQAFVFPLILICMVFSIHQAVNSVLTLSTYRYHQLPLVSGSVRRDSPQLSNFRSLSQVTSASDCQL